MFWLIAGRRPGNHSWMFRYDRRRKARIRDGRDGEGSSGPNMATATVALRSGSPSRPSSPTLREPYRDCGPPVDATRTVSVPSFAAEALRRRLAVVAAEPADHLLFFTRNGTPLTTNNVRRRLRSVLDDAGIEGVTPHS